MNLRELSEWIGTLEEDMLDYTIVSAEYIGEDEGGIKYLPLQWMHSVAVINGEKQIMFMCNTMEELGVSIDEINGALDGHNSDEISIQNEMDHNVSEHLD